VLPSIIGSIKYFGGSAITLAFPSPLQEVEQRRAVSGQLAPFYLTVT
jgi:hypothetical protein